MRLRWAELLVLWLTASAPAEAQQPRELGFQAVAISSEPALLVAGPYGAVRTGGRSRLSASVAGGVSDGDFAWRAEGLGHFLLTPGRRSGWGPYFAGGLAVVGGPVDRGYIVLTLGIEGRPGGPSGWVAEVGVGGGVRLGVGYRWRRLTSTHHK